MRKWAVLLALIMAVLCLTGCQNDQSSGKTADAVETKYQKAQKLLSQNQFAEAAAAFSELGGYEDSSKLAMYCKAAAAGEEGNYENAFETFETLGDYKDSKMMLTYYHGRMNESFAEMFPDDEYSFYYLALAISDYRSILFFRDSEERAERCHRAIFDEADRREQAGDLEIAEELFALLENDEEAAARLAELGMKIKRTDIIELCPGAVEFGVLPAAEDMIVARDPGLFPRVDTFLVATDENKEVVGYAVIVTGQGFGGNFTMGIGFTRAGVIQKILFKELHETAGLGMKADNDEFKSQFIGKAGKLELEIWGADNNSEISAISGATVTSRAVVNAVNAGTEFLYQVTGMETVNRIAQGFGGDVTVRLVREGSMVLALWIDAPYETKGLGALVTDDRFISQFIGKEGPFVYGENGIDAVSGATVTSNAVLIAINEVFSDGKDDAADLQPWEQDGEKIKDELEEAGYEVDLSFGSGDSEANETLPEETEDVSGEKNISYKYISEQETPFSVIRVKVNAADGKITECCIESEDKHGGVDFLTDEIRDAWAKAIVEYGTADNDVITSATIKYSSEAVINAMNDILEQIGTPIRAETHTEESVPETTEDQEETALSAGKTVSEVITDPSRVIRGSYTAKRETPFSIIRVTIDSEGGRIVRCKITSEAKSEGSDFLTDGMKEEWAKGTAETDIITGATVKFSSEAVTDAVNEILGQIK